MDDFKLLPLIRIDDLLEEKYGFDCDINELFLKYPDDEMIKYYYERLKNFKVWESKRKFYYMLNEIGQAMFISITDRYGEGWNLHDLTQKYPDDELVDEFDSYLDYLERVGSLYSILKRDGVDISSL